MSLSKSKHPHKSYTRRQKLLIGLFVFIVVDIALFTFTVTRYNGYDLINSRKYVEFKMPKDKSMSARQWQALVKNAKVNRYPKTQLTREIAHIKSQYEKRIKEYDMTFKEYLKEAGMNETAFNNQITEMAKENVRDKLVLHAIADKKGISVSKAELEKAKKGLLKEKGVSSETEYKKLTGETINEHVKEIDLESKLLYAKIVKK
ncbi:MULTISPECIES: trigger factor, C-terminal domain protein [Mogibacterium]|jgi:Bacterial trigger factor protein (TF) C-terminus.|uniref:Trigger factor, C-terminal domain protein n=2 Tax=Mogibacterium timidum TaxID=35519 RepID=X8J7T9_9FIRM|nr:MULTISPECIES: trigger factor, C-terminal domain protein [Mogibacterium]EJU20675.1 trigger factor, C-terminal domain protein [Mogibacterium sp. CM50]EUC57997.1 trigger factor, C-terminal domain protein [Mogibacterium timidum ATCC 33093]NWO23733.1 hypothetical protein [Mogibacterium timidum]